MLPLIFIYDLTVNELTVFILFRCGRVPDPRAGGQVRGERGVLQPAGRVRLQVQAGLGGRRPG